MNQSEIEPNILKWVIEDCYLLADDSTGSAIRSRAAARLMASLKGEGLNVAIGGTDDEFCITFNALAFPKATRCRDADGIDKYVGVELLAKSVGPARTGGEIADAIDPDRFKVDDSEDNEKDGDEG